MNKVTMKYFLDKYIAREKERIEDIILQCESPMEELFAIAFHSCGAIDNIEGFMYCVLNKAVAVSFEKQIKVGKYRADFLIRFTNRETHKTERAYVVEIDGHDFHEKTKEQVKRRNERDRFFASKDIMVFHFSGSEVYEDPDKCVESVVDLIMDTESRRREE